MLGQVFEERPLHRWRQAQRLPTWFSNLLPEQRLREIVAEQYGISSRNEFRLLLALGSDLPGAIQVIPDSDPQGGIGGPGNGSTSSGKDALTVGLRDNNRGEDERYMVSFSLAGAQLKLSMLRSVNTLMLSGKGELGDHLVKIPSIHYEDVPENEFSMMTWARESGITVPDFELLPTDDLCELPPGFGTLKGSHVYVVRRFDRKQNALVSDERIHMEDLNQVVGNWPDDMGKYKGASFERIGRIISALCGKMDFLEYVRRLTFCIGIGNEDAHLKNWTIWYPNQIQPRLSPAYDLVSTIQYDLDRGMALKLRGKRDPSQVDIVAMQRLARETGVDRERVKETVEETLEKMRSSWRHISSNLPITRSFRNRLRNYQESIPLTRLLVR